MHGEDQLTSISFFTFPKKHYWWAFNQMQLARPMLNQIQGVRFAKLLGTGGGFGFSLKPDFATYALLLSWNKLEFAKCFSDSPIFTHFSQKAESSTTHWMACVQSSGSWGGHQPFTPSQVYRDGKIMVITRARVRLTKMHLFLSNVPKASRSVQAAEGLLYTKGIGEWPAIEQATFSIWESQHQMMSYAYREAHQEIIRKVKKQRWYAEELFARFVPVTMPK